MGQLFTFPKKSKAVENRITVIEKTLRESSPSIENLEDLQNRVMAVENRLTDIMQYISDFGTSDANKTGTRGLVPAPPQTDSVIVLTNSGWQQFTAADLLINELPTLAEPLTYNRQAQTPKWNNYDPLKLVIGGDYKDITDAGTYTVTFTPSGNLTWADNTRVTRYVEYTIAPKKVAVPTVTNTTKTYNKQSQSPTVGTYDSAEITVSDTSKTAAGSYSVKFNLTSTKNYTWTDGTTATKTADWVINVLKLTKPTASKTTLTYSGQTLPLSVSNYNSNYMTRSGYEGTDAGSYTAKYVLSDKTSTQWADGSTADVSISWKIETLLLDKPTASKTVYPCTGSNIALAVTGYNATYMNRSGTYQATNPGNYSAVYSLKSNTNTRWKDNTSASVTISWQIQQIEVAIPTWDNATLTYNGSLQTAGFKNYNTTYMTVTGNTATAAGTHTATFTLKDKNAYLWTDKKTDDKTVSWVINTASVTIPTGKTTSFNYDGNAKTAEFNNYNSNLMTVTGNTATDAGTHTATFELKDKANYKWSDGTTTNKTVSWTIQSVSVTIPTWNNASMTFNNTAQTATFNNFNADLMTVEGNTQTGAGTHTATFRLKDTNTYHWSDGTTTKKTVNWTIKQLVLPLPEWDGATITYDGTEKTANIKNFNATYNYVWPHNGCALLTQTEPRTYNSRIIIPDNYRASVIFSDGTYEKDILWTINRITLAIPEWDGVKIPYNGTDQLPNMKNYDGTKMTYSPDGNIYVYNAETDNRAGYYRDPGSYKMTVFLTDSHYQWTDGTTENKYVEYQISKAAVPSSWTFGVSLRRANNLTDWVETDNQSCNNGGTVSLALPNRTDNSLIKLYIPDGSGGGLSGTVWLARNPDKKLDFKPFGNRSTDIYTSIDMLAGTSYTNNVWEDTVYFEESSGNYEVGFFKFKVTITNPDR